MRLCGEVGKVSETYCPNMCSMDLRLIGVVDLKLAKKI